MNISKEQIHQILVLDALFDKENAGARMSGHFDSDLEYHGLKIDFILKRLQ